LKNFIKNNLCTVSRLRARERNPSWPRPRRDQRPSRPRPVLWTLRVSREFGLIFCSVAGFLKTCGLLVFSIWACFNWNLLVFLQIFVLRIAFFQILWHFCCFSSLIKAYIGRVCLKICSFWACFFGFAYLLYYLIFLLIYHFVEFSFQRMMGLFFGEIAYFLHVFQIFFLFFRKITWHHWPRLEKTILETRLETETKSRDSITVIYFRLTPVLNMIQFPDRDPTGFCNSEPDADRTRFWKNSTGSELDILTALITAIKCLIVVFRYKLD